jgi:hypothetical protein
MSAFSLDIFLGLLEEVMVGKTKEQTWVIDREPGHGILRTVEALTAAEASEAAVEGGSTVAAHAGHVRWSLGFALGFFQGNGPIGDWAESWTVKTVSEQEWAQLRNDLRIAYEKIKTAIQQHSDWSDPQFAKGTLAMLPHLGYHLGAIRQKMVAIRPQDIGA